jgi:thioredoxin reductase (NADPH)
MSLHTLAMFDARIARRIADPGALTVFCLCAAWCDTCRSFRPGFERLAAASPERVFVWLDIEDDAELCGDIDVETFPTLAVFRGTTLLHFGAVLPQEAGIGRLLTAVASIDGALLDPPAAAGLARRLIARAG